MNLALKKFDLTNISSDKVCVFIGKRETGKSFLVKDLLYHHKDVPIGTVISGTESANCFYGNIVPSLFIHDAYTPEIVANTLKRQKMVIKKINNLSGRFWTGPVYFQSTFILNGSLPQPLYLVGVVAESIE